MNEEKVQTVKNVAVKESKRAWKGLDYLANGKIVFMQAPERYINQLKRTDGSGFCST